MYYVRYTYRSGVLITSFLWLSLSISYSLVDFIQIVSQKLKRSLVNAGQDSFHSWHNMSCCLPRQNCRNRKGWTSVKSEKVPIVSAYGLLTPLGNTNFLDEVYRF